MATHTRRMPFEHEDRGQGEAPRNAKDARRETWTDPPSQPSEGTNMLTPGLGLSVSRM